VFACRPKDKTYIVRASELAVGVVGQSTYTYMHTAVLDSFRPKRSSLRNSQDRPEVYPLCPGVQSSPGHSCTSLGTRPDDSDSCLTEGLRSMVEQMSRSLCPSSLVSGSPSLKWLIASEILYPVVGLGTRSTILENSISERKTCVIVKSSPVRI
jgi:hypothetical protein